MHSGPLRQGIAVMGLLALTPTMVFLALGKLQAGQAALRAMVTFGVVILIGRALAMSLRFYVRQAERSRGVGAAQLRRTGDRAG